MPWNLIEELEDDQIVDPPSSDLLYELAPISGKTAFV
jgi:hypothetical protein